jgi:glutaredoxin-like protein
MATLNASLQNQLLAFTRTNDGDEGACEACNDTRELVEELASISSGNVRTEIYDVDQDVGEARIYGIDKTPAIVVLGDESGRRDFGIRFFGSLAGYEFGTLIDDIHMVSHGTSDLAEGTVEVLSRVTVPVRLQVFVTPTCPYCPRAVRLAHKMAMASDWVTSNAVDATEFPDLAQRYQVYGVLKTVINETVHVEGAVPEARLMAQLIPLLEVNAPPAA